MAWKCIEGLPGRVFIPDEEEEGLPKKHPCKSCFSCQQCGENRCRICLNARCSGKNDPDAD